MISKIERAIAFRYLKPKKKEGFLKVISIFSFTGITLGVAILIIVMSVMNGFRTELISKILGFNPHIIVKPYERKINEIDVGKIEKLKKNILRTSFTFNGQGILINKQSNSFCLRLLLIELKLAKALETSKLLQDLHQYFVLQKKLKKMVLIIPKHQ